MLIKLIMAIRFLAVAESNCMSTERRVTLDLADLACVAPACCSSPHDFLLVQYFSTVKGSYESCKISRNLVAWPRRQSLEPARQGESVYECCLEALEDQQSYI